MTTVTKNSRLVSLAPIASASDALGRVTYLQNYCIGRRNRCRTERGRAFWQRLIRATVAAEKEVPSVENNYLADRGTTIGNAVPFYSYGKRITSGSLKRSEPEKMIRYEVKIGYEPDFIGPRPADGVAHSYKVAEKVKTGYKDRNRNPFIDLSDEAKARRDARKAAAYDPIAYGLEAIAGRIASRFVRHNRTNKDLSHLYWEMKDEAKSGLGMAIAESEAPERILKLVGETYGRTDWKPCQLPELSGIVRHACAVVDKMLRKTYDGFSLAAWNWALEQLDKADDTEYEVVQYNLVKRQLIERMREMVKRIRASGADKRQQKTAIRLIGRAYLYHIEMVETRGAAQFRFAHSLGFKTVNGKPEPKSALNQRFARVAKLLELATRPMLRDVSGKAREAHPLPFKVIDQIGCGAVRSQKPETIRFVPCYVSTRDTSAGWHRLALSWKRCDDGKARRLVEFAKA